MDRIELVKKLLRERRISSRSVRQYTESEHEYLPGKKILMREAHFLAAIDPGGNTGSELAGRLQYSLSAVSQLGSRMEKKGYIRRTVNTNDRRQTLFLLTEEGAALKEGHEKFDEQAYKKISRKLESYSDDELEMFVEYEKIAATFYEMDPPVDEGYDGM